MKQAAELASLYASKVSMRILSVAHHEVPDYLSAADFAFATYKEGSSKKYLSPIKMGEYWANGLPVLLTSGVGDESDYLEREKGGVLIDINEQAQALAFEKMERLLGQRGHIASLAEKYRSFDRVAQVYDRILRAF